MAMNSNKGGKMKIGFYRRFIQITTNIAIASLVILSFTVLGFILKFLCIQFMHGWNVLHF